MLLDTKIQITATNDGVGNNNIKITFSENPTISQVRVTLEHALYMLDESFINYLKNNNLGEEYVDEQFKNLTMKELYA